MVLKLMLEQTSICEAKVWDSLATGEQGGRDLRKIGWGRYIEPWICESLGLED